MENIIKEWKLYTKKILLNRLYKNKRNPNVTNFLKNYNLLKVNVLNREPYEFKMEIIFSQNSEIVKIIGQFEPRDLFFYLVMPEEFDILELEEILEEFDFRSYVE